MYYILHPKVSNYWEQFCLNNVAEYLGMHYECEVFDTIQKDKGTPIVVGAHYWNYLPKDAIIFNAEQLNKGSGLVSDWYLKALKKASNVIDYDDRNKTGEVLEIKPSPLWLKKFNVDSLPKDIEVLHYGSMNFRRQYVIEHLTKAGIAVTVANQMFGYQIDDLIARSKYVLHIHYYDEGYYAPFRCTYAMHGAEVLAEQDRNTPDYINQWNYDDLDGLVDMIKNGIKNESRIKIIEDLKNDIR